MRHRFFFSSVIPIVSAIALGSALALYVQHRISQAANPATVTAHPATPVTAPTPAEQLATPVAAPTPAEQPANHVAAPTPAEQPADPVADPTPAEQPANPVAAPTPAEQPADPVAEKLFKQLETYSPYTPHPLIIAAEQGDIEKAKSLLTSGEDINMQNFCGFAPLHAAICAKQPQMVLFLIENGADVNRTDHLARSPLMLAALHRQTETVYELLKAGADRSHTDLQRKSIYYYAKAGGVPELISLFDF